MNILSGNELHSCTSCQLCAAVCPTGALDIHLNEEGFYRPFIDGTKCIDCSLCVKACYKFDKSVSISPENILSDLPTYAAYAKDNTILNEVTSGGVADVMAKELINLGYKCVGVVYKDEKQRAENSIASNKEETDAFRGSKYIQSYTLETFKQLIKDIKSQKYAVFGLPCHIYALNRFLDNKRIRENVILIDLFCHGCPSMLVWNKYENSIKHICQNRPFKKVKFRSKVKGWGNFYVQVLDEEGRSFVGKPGKDEFYTLFFSNQILNDSCADCLLRGTLDYTDIRLGDFWGKRYASDKKGVSAVVICSHRGKDIFEHVSKQLVYVKSTLPEVLKGQSYSTKYDVNYDLREKMLKDLIDPKIDLKNIVKLYEDKQGLKYKLKKVLKVLDWYFPFNFQRHLKKLGIK